LYFLLSQKQAGGGLGPEISGNRKHAGVHCQDVQIARWHVAQTPARGLHRKAVVA